MLTQALAEQEIDVPHSGTCVASSIEFNLAKEMPAEFTRFVEGLTSPNVSVEKTIKLKNLADNNRRCFLRLNFAQIFRVENFVGLCFDLTKGLKAPQDLIKDF